jgi:hypothetical protein
MFGRECLREILCRWESTDIRRREGFLPVWDLGQPGFLARHRRQRREAIASCRRETLIAFLEGEGSVFLVHEPPQDYEVPGDWQRVGVATWLVPPDVNLEHPAVAYWLFVVGNWRLYRAPAPTMGNAPDAFRCRAAELLSWMQAESVQALIESFHDDSAWVVALDTAVELTENRRDLA